MILLVLQSTISLPLACNISELLRRRLLAYPIGTLRRCLLEFRKFHLSAIDKLIASRSTIKKE